MRPQRGVRRAMSLASRRMQSAILDTEVRQARINAQCTVPTPRWFIMIRFSRIFGVLNRKQAWLSRRIPEQILRSVNVSVVSGVLGWAVPSLGFFKCSILVGHWLVVYAYMSALCIRLARPFGTYIQHSPCGERSVRTPLAQGWWFMDLKLQLRRMEAVLCTCS